MLILQPITGWYSIYGVAQHGIHVCIDLVRQIWRRMFQQSLYYGSGNTVLSKDRAESAAQIVESEICDPCSLKRIDKGFPDTFHGLLSEWVQKHIF